MGDLIEPTYEDTAERRAAASRVGYHDYRLGAWAEKRHCAPEPTVADRRDLGPDADPPFLAYDPTGSVKFNGEGHTADWAVSDYYALNNTTDKYPKRGQEGQYH